jgi:hypothetical protein
MATYKQRDNGAWQAVIRRKGFPVQSKTFEKKTDAEIWARKVESDLDRGIYIPANEAERTTLGDLIKEFVTDFAPHHYRQREDKKEAWRFQCDRLSEAMGMRPLFVTAYKGYAEIVRLLLAGGAQSDTIDPGGGDALWAARMNGHHEIVNLLEANRAEPGRLLPDMH